MTVNFDINFKFMNHKGEMVETYDLAHVQAAESLSENQFIGYSIKPSITGDIKQVRTYLLAKIAIVFRKKLSYVHGDQDNFSKSISDPIEFLKTAADKLKNPKDWGAYVGSFVWTSDYQAFAQRHYDNICTLYKELKAPANP